MCFGDDRRRPLLRAMHTEYQNNQSGQNATFGYEITKTRTEITYPRYDYLLKESEYASRRRKPLADDDYISTFRYSATRKILELEADSQQLGSAQCRSHKRHLLVAICGLVSYLVIFCEDQAQSLIEFCSSIRRESKRSGHWRLANPIKFDHSLK